jgi:hypothetical protein
MKEAQNIGLLTSAHRPPVTLSPVSERSEMSMPMNESESSSHREVCRLMLVCISAPGRRGRGIGGGGEER